MHSCYTVFENSVLFENMTEYKHSIILGHFVQMHYIAFLNTHFARFYRLLKHIWCRNKSGLTLSHDKGGKGSGSEGRAHGVALLGEVDPAVPAAPCLGGGKHTTSTAHLHWSQGNTTEAQNGTLKQRSAVVTWLRVDVRQAAVAMCDGRQPSSHTE